jgi:sulfite dehydrogenase (quinone) subunit SoeC
MHPAPSVIVFTVLSGLGFGFLAILGFGVLRPTGLGAIPAYGLGYALAVGGLLSSTLHLGRPERALRAFTQWRTSWLSREGWASVAALLLTALVALRAVGGGSPGLIGAVAGLLCIGTVFTTSMIYTQLKTVPRWNHWATPALFLLFAVAGGLTLALKPLAAALAYAALGLLLWWNFRDGDTRFAARGQTIGHVVGRKHSARLRIIAIALGAAIPAVLCFILPTGLPAALLAAVIHLIGAFTARWLFFAEAEHVVGLYYGQR